MGTALEPRIEFKTSPARHIDSAPVFAMGEHVVFRAIFKNVGQSSASVNDPRSSQKLILKVYTEKRQEPLTILINPGFVDVTGEKTVRPTHMVDIPAGGEIIREIDLHQVCPDHCFVSGRYSLTIKHDEVVTAAAPFAIEFHDTSVPLLINIVVDEAADRSLRLEAKQWLDRLPRPPRVVVVGAADNKRNATAFLASWDQEKSSKDTRAVFDAARLK